MSNQGRSPYAQEHWQRWEMDAFDMPSSPAAEVEPDVDMEAILAEIAELKALAQQQGHAEGYAKGHQQGLEKGQPEGYKTGFDEGKAKGTEQGYTEGYEKGSQTAAQESAQLASITHTTATALNQLHEDLGQAVLALAVDIAQHVLQTELKQYPEQLIPLIQDVLKDTEQSDQAVTILLNPDDVALVEQHLADDLQHNNWRLKADEAIRAGGVEIKTALGHIDATLETRWRRALSRLGPSDPNISL